MIVRCRHNAAAVRLCAPRPVPPLLAASRFCCTQHATCLPPHSGNPLASVRRTILGNRQHGGGSSMRGRVGKACEHTHGGAAREVPTVSALRLRLAALAAGVSGGDAGGVAAGMEGARQGCAGGCLVQPVGGGAWLRQDQPCPQRQGQWPRRLGLLPWRDRRCRGGKGVGCRHPRVRALARVAGAWRGRPVRGCCFGRGAHWGSIGRASAGAQRQPRCWQMAVCGLARGGSRPAGRCEPPELGSELWRPQAWPAGRGVSAPRGHC